MIDAGAIPFVDVTAVRMLVEAGEQLAATGVELAVAHDIGQVRDVLRADEQADASVKVYPTVAAAVDALRGR